MITIAKTAVSINLRRENYKPAKTRISLLAPCFDIWTIKQMSANLKYLQKLNCQWICMQRKPPVQFANIRKMVLRQTSYTVYSRDSTHAWYVMPKVLSQVYMHDPKIWKLFRTCGNRQKRAKCDQFLHPRSDFLNFCNPYFFPIH